MKRTSISDIAERLGVSAYTVSKALRGQAKVSEAMRQKVIETAKEMNYIPNQSAKRLVGREYRIAVVYPEQPKEFYAYWLNGVKKAAASLIDSRVTVEYYPCESISSASGYREALDNIHQHPPDGVIIVNCYENIAYRAELERLRNDGIPVLYSVIGSNFQYPYIGYTVTDARLIGSTAAEFLNDCARISNKIAIFAGHADSDLHKVSIASFREHIRENVLEECYFTETEEERSIAYRAAEVMLAMHPDIGGIWVTSYNAVGVCDCIEHYGLQRKVIIVGCDLYPTLNEKLINGTLTVSLFQNQSELGAEAMRELYSYINGSCDKKSFSCKMPVSMIFSSMLKYFPEYL